MYERYISRYLEFEWYLKNAYAVFLLKVSKHYRFQNANINGPIK